MNEELQTKLLDLCIAHGLTAQQYQDFLKLFIEAYNYKD